MNMSYTLYEFRHSQFQGLDYVFSEETNTLVMLPHGDEDGKMYNRGGQEISEAKILEIANIIRSAFARKYTINESEITISAAPCYPNTVHKNVKSLEILGDWNTPTWAAPDAIGLAFIIKSHDCSVRAGWNNC
jgi:hypothetical protein